jgi:RND superfamily putative drug exporter
LLRALAAWCHDHRRRVAAAWAVVFVAVVVVASVVGGTFSQGVSLGDTESSRATRLLETRFPRQAGDEGQIVFAATRGVEDPGVERVMTRVFAAVSRVAHVTDVQSPYAGDGGHQIGDGGDVAYATVQFDRRAQDIPKSSIDAIRRLAHGPHGVDVELGGSMFKLDTSTGPAELIGILAAIVVLLVTFGSLIATALPILMALCGVAIGVGFVNLLSHVVPMPDFATSLASMLGIGVGIDYALFVLTRHRETLGEGRDVRDAAVHSVSAAGRAVLFAGCTVVISVLGLFLIGVGILDGMAVGSAVTIVVVMAASVTLLPAVLGFVGRKIERQSIGRRRRARPASSEGAWFRWSRVVQRRPWQILGASLLVLVTLSVPLLSMRLAFPDAGGRPKSDTTRQAYDLMTHAFGAGYNGPLVLAAAFPTNADTSALDRLTRALRTTPDVAAVRGPVRNGADDAAVIMVTPASSPSSAATHGLLDRLRSTVVPRAVDHSSVRVYVGGLTASSVDVSNRLGSRLPLFIGVVILLSFLLLAAVFRSVLVPLKAALMNLLSIGAAYGVVVAVFQWGWLANVFGVAKTGPIMPFFPMMMFAILFGLSMDYEVFLLSRIREEYDRTGDNRRAVADGLASTGRVITAAALIMVTVFGSFVLGSSPTIKLFGLGLATAIFVDATIVRTMLVPATMEVLGDANWWLPRWLDRLLPRLQVEGPSTEVILRGAVHADRRGAQ